MASSPKAVLLASWTRLGADSFATIYSSVAHADARAWPVLVAAMSGPGTRDDEEALILAACEEAAARGFLAALARAVANVEMSLAKRSRTDVDELIDDVAVEGEMQGLADEAAGLLEEGVIAALGAATQACAIVSDRDRQLGTAFLVAPDLVLTAAHVALAPTADASAWSDTLRPGLSFAFKPAPTDPNRSRVPVLAADKAALVASSPPFGKPPAVLYESLDAKASANLDYAVIRLARQVSHITPLDMRSPARVELNRSCFVMGFTTGNALKWDGARVGQLCTEASRWLHPANAVPGMSGGCCIGPEGRVVGIHEGAVPRRNAANAIERDANGKPRLNNRGVSLAAIRASQIVNGRDPLDRRPEAQGLEFVDADMVDRLYKSGLRLAGADLKPTWQMLVQGMIGLDDLPRDGIVWPAFHPWIARREVETWIDARKPAERIAHVDGAEGVGKSFCINILAAKLAMPLTDLLIVNATKSSTWSFAQALQPATDSLVVRTAAAAQRYDDVPSIIARLSPARNPGRSAANPLFVAVDFERNDEGIRFGHEPWLQFIDALAAEDWVRVMLIGLNEVERDVVGDMERVKLLDRVAFELAPLGEKDLGDFAIALGRARGSGRRPSELRADIAALWASPGLLRGTRPSIQTAQAALVAIAFEQTL